MHVREIMTPDPEVIRPDAALRELESRLLAQRVGGYPVVDGHTLVGIVSRSDLVRILEIEHALDAQLDHAAGEVDEADEAAHARERGARIGARLASMTVADVMVRDVHAVSSATPVAEAARAMVENRVHRLPVVDDGRLVGIVTSLDLAELLAKGYA